MRNKVMAALASLLLVLGAVVSAAPAAQAAVCRYVNVYESVNTSDGTTTVRASLYACDYGSYERVESVAFYFNTSYIRKIYDNGSARDTNIRQGCAGSWSQLLNRSAYYNGSRYKTTQPYCAEPTIVSMRLTLDMRYAPDKDYSENAYL